MVHAPLIRSHVSLYADYTVERSQTIFLSHCIINVNSSPAALQGGCFYPYPPLLLISRLLSFLSC